MLEAAAIDQVSARIAEIAATAIVPRYQALAAHEIALKGPSDYVTAADLEAEALLERALADILPGSVVVGEEAVAKNANVLDRLAEAGPVWIVDPLDGTWEYGQGRVDFAVHVVLWSADPAAPGGGRLSAGTVDLPAQGLARRSDDVPVPVRGLPQDRPVRIVASRTRPPAVLADVVAVLDASLREQGHPYGVEVIDVGSVGAKVNEILSGRAEAYVHDTGFYEWDVAAPLAVAHAHGLTASHVDGRPVSFNLERPYVTDFLVGLPDFAEQLRAGMLRASGA